MIPRLPARALLALSLLALFAGCVNQPWDPAGSAQRAASSRAVPRAPLGVIGTAVASQGGPSEAIPASPAVYLLPYRAGTSHTCVQPGPGPFSHSGTQKYAVDFGMSVGTPILASRAGRVVEVKEDSNRGGASSSMARHGNYVRVAHSDGTSALYLHLRQNGAHVQVGDIVRRGQHIGDSGNTGWSAMPHLHIQIDRRNARGQWASIRFKFKDVRGDGVPGFLGSYRSRNAAR